VLHGIDYFVVIAYLIGIMLLGLYFSRFIHSAQDYFLSGRMLPFWAIAMSIVATDIGALDFVGVAGQAHTDGIAVGNFDWLGSVPAMLLAAFVFVPYFWRAGFYTIPEYVGRRYNDYVRATVSLIWIVFYAFDLGVIFWATGLLLEELMGWPVWVSVLATAGIVGVYTISGGLTAVIMTDVVQMIIMFVGGGAVVVMGFWKVGGWSGLSEKISAMGPAYQHHFELVLSPRENTPFPWTGILFGLTFVMANAYMIGNQAIVQRCLAAKSVWHAKASMIFGAFLKMFIPLLTVFPGLMAVVLLSDSAQGDKAFPAMIKAVLPPGMVGLLFAAFLAGLMSTIDSLLNSGATLWTKDLYERFIRRGAGAQHYLRVGRMVTAVLLIFGVITTPVTALFDGLYEAIQTYLSVFQGPLFSLLLLGIFWKRATQWGGLAGLAGGLVVSVSLFVMRGRLFTIDSPFLYISWWSFVAAVLVNVLVSFATAPHPQERLHGLVYRLARPAAEKKDLGAQNA
jgi:SSS family solute:Na+ symporter